MKKFCLFVIGLIFFFTSQATAQNKVVVIPLIEEVKCECTGMLSSQGRWCVSVNLTPSSQD